jgi:ATP-dependent helicase/nuclease subunit A
VVRAEAAGPPSLDLAFWREAAEALAGGGVEDNKGAARFRQVIATAEAGKADFEAAWTALFTDKNERRYCKKPPKALVNAGLLPAVEAEQGRLEAARGLACAATVARDTVHALILGAAYGAAYEEVKRRRGLLDFSDLVHRTHELLTKRADAAWVLYKLDGGIDHVLVDEAQDTAPEQWDILRSLTDAFFAGEGPPRLSALERTVFAVGDEKQSIYSFQGARPERLRSELLAYDALVTGAVRDFKAVSLQESWRSTPQVLRFVDTVFADPATRAGVPAPYGEDVIQHVARRGDAGCVDLWPPEEEPATPDRDAWDKPVDAESAGSARKRLARRIALDIKGAVTRGEAVGTKGSGRPRAVGYEDFLILVRRRDALFDEIIRALKLSGVPVGGADRLKLSDHILFKDLLALARVALFPEDDLSLAALLRSPFFDVDEDGLYALARGRKGKLWLALRDKRAERPAFEDAYARLAALRRISGAAQPYEFYARFLAQTDGDGRSMTARALTRLGREAEDALEAFLGEAIAAEGRGVHGLEAFAAALERSELEVKREQEDGRGEVRVMTVHGAKGLEAPVVYLPDTTMRARAQGPALLPDGEGGFLYAPRKGDDCDSSRAARDLREAETDKESLRLLYVALTRARDRLVICGRVGAGREPEPGSWYERCVTGFDGLETRPVVHRTAR